MREPKATSDDFLLSESDERVQHSITFMNSQKPYTPPDKKEDSLS